MAEYTKGNWEHRKAGHLAQYEVFSGDWREPENILATGILNEANARLISASPDLYEACLEFMKGRDMYDPAYQTIIKALAKAESK